MFLKLDLVVGCCVHGSELSGFVNTLNAELNPSCYLLALLWAQHILHFGRVRVKGAKLLDKQRLKKGR